MGTVEEIVHDIVALEHYGVKGMHWGVRTAGTSVREVSRRNVASYRTRKAQRQARKPQPSADAVAARTANEKRKKGGVASLSNDELLQLTTRMNLETSYSRAMANHPDHVATSFIGNLLVKQGQNQVNRVANEASTKATDAALHLAWKGTKKLAKAVLL